MKEFRGYRRGVDLGGWLSQCDNTIETYETFIKEEDFRTISEWGLDHVRIPVDYDLIEYENGNSRDEGWQYLDRAIEWAGKYGLNAIIDLHKTFGYSFDIGENEEGFFESETYQERFYALWETFAKRYGRFSERVAFELLNEVTDPSYSDPWNRIAAECIKRIRNICPDVRIIVGGYYNNSIEALKDLLWPTDENIVYTFHCYNPLIFTHQGAYWIPTMDTSFRISVSEPYGVMKEAARKQLGNFYDDLTGWDDNDKLSSAYYEKLFAQAREISLERDVPLYCGEYGVVDLADAHETLNWYRIIHETFEKFDIGRAAWNYHGKDFGLVDDHMKDVLEELITLL